MDGSAGAAADFADLEIDLCLPKHAASRWPGLLQKEQTRSEVGCGHAVLAWF